MRLCIRNSDEYVGTWYYFAMAKLVLVRHSKSTWNALGLWTGWTNIGLAPEGKKDARAVARVVRNITFDLAYCSELKRARETLEIIKRELALRKLPTVWNKALNERHYGIYTGKNKWQIKEEVGDAVFKKLRRGWNYPTPKGETLKDVYERIVPYYKKNILSDLKAGKNVLVVAHGNSLRALVKFLEELNVQQVADLEFGLSEAYVYDVNLRGKITAKEIRGENKNRGKV